ncbi:hypothetical protein KQX54_004578 [Cotesia glomerata]|uniref:Uncharacterized protein n=1 Tax=Cotesia glomerata TaxID=32391 RepID=A0AAV7ILD0_COTGL|nr:hypothetical protein KQX54_004578 [Cotesia glomerata]
MTLTLALIGRIQLNRIRARSPLVAPVAAPVAPPAAESKPEPPIALVEPSSRTLVRTQLVGRCCAMAGKTDLDLFVGFSSEVVEHLYGTSEVTTGGVTTPSGKT